MKEEYSGLFITFEGTEGCGKSTHIPKIVNWLNSLKYPVVNSREPGGVLLSEKIRELILNPDYPKKPVTELFLYEAARTEVVSSIIIPNLKDGKIVIFDRFYDSTTAYQGYGGSLDLKLIEELNNVASQGISPDITFILNVPIIQGLERAGKVKQEFKKRDWQESKSLEFHKKVKEGYLKMAEENPERFKIINTDDSVKINNAQDSIKGYIKKLIKSKDYTQFKID